MTENIFDMLDQKNLYLVKVDIFSRLDYRSLHTCRQVCKEWNELVREEFWFSRTRRPLMKNRLLTEWKTAEPLRKTFHLPSTRGFYLACDNKTVCVGTRNSQAIVLDTDTGQQLASLACDPRSDLSESDLLDDESRDVQLDLTESHIVTVTGSGVISVWRREGLDLIYQSSHHGQDSILGVSLVGDLLITGSSHGSLAALTVRSDTVTLDWVSSTKKMRAISHIHSDGSNVVVGTDVGMSVWDFQDRRRPQLIRDIPCGQVCCCVLSLPLAACTGLFLDSGLQLWDFLTGQKLRHILTDVNLWVIEIKNNFLATSMSIYSEEEEEDELHPKIFLYDIDQLKDLRIEETKLWSRNISCAIEDKSDPHIALNSTNVFALTRDVQEGSKVHVWNFWNY